MEHIANIGSADSLLSNLDTTGIKSSTFGLVDPIGYPRYVKCMVSILHPIVFANFVALASLMLMGTRDDLL